MKVFDLRFVPVFLTILFASFSCSSPSGQSDAETSESDAQIQVAVIPKGSTHVFWRSVHAGAVKASQELGVEIIWQAPQKEDDRDRQIQVMQNAISRKVDAIVLAPLDSRALIPAVKSAQKRSIPVVIFDSALDYDETAGYVSTDNAAGGRLCGEYMVEQLGGKGKLIMLRYQEGSASTTEREQGFMEVIEQHPDIEVVSSNQFAGATMESALRVSQNLLNRYPGIDGIYCPNESSTTGMLRALQIAGLAGKIKFVGFDSNDPMKEAISKGELQGAAIQDPFNMGYMGVKTAVAVIRGENYEERVDTGVRLLTQENFEEPDIQALINPDLEKWLE